MSPLVSVIIPAHNSENWLEATLRSVLDQTWQHIEVIVVDDGSSDGTLRVAQSYASDRVRIFTQENRGAAAARNRGVLAACGDFIQFLDADDLLEPRKIEVQLRRLMEEGGDCVAAGSWAMFSGSPEGVMINPEPLWRDMDPVAWVCALFCRKGMMPIHAWLVPRQIAEKAGPWDECLTLNDDREYSTRVVLASRGVAFCADATSYYRITGHESLSRCRSRASLESGLRVVERNVTHLLAVEDSPLSRSACATELAGFAISAFENCPELARRTIERIHELNVTGYQLPFGGFFGVAAKVVGWENALYFKRVIKKLWT